MIPIKTIPGVGEGDKLRRGWIKVWYIWYLLRTFVTGTMYSHPAQPKREKKRKIWITNQQNILELALPYNHQSQNNWSQDLDEIDTWATMFIEAFIIHFSQTVKTAQRSVNRYMNKENVVYTVVWCMLSIISLSFTYAIFHRHIFSSGSYISLLPENKSRESLSTITYNH
jgi:hypothetical protein